MHEAHGIAIICERAQGHTVAWVDHYLSKRVPAGYFTETWVSGPWYKQLTIETHAGTLGGGYFTELYGFNPWREPTVEQVTWHDWYDAVVWCREHARQKGAA